MARDRNSHLRRPCAAAQELLKPYGGKLTLQPGGKHMVGIVAVGERVLGKLRFSFGNSSEETYVVQRTVQQVRQLLKENGYGT